MTIITDGTNVVTITLWDSATGAAGNVLLKIGVAGPDKGMSVMIPDPGLQAFEGIYAEVTGTNAQCVIFHK
jgi:hypothetical protein